MNEKIRMPTWAVGLIWGLMGALFAGGLAWGAQRQDVGLLKERVSRLEKLPEIVSGIRSDVTSIKEQQTEMRQDVKQLLRNNG